MTSEHELSERAQRNLIEGYDLGAIQDAWDRGDYGVLYCYDTGEPLRPATADEAIASYEEDDEGVIEVDWRGEGGWRGRDVRPCYVLPW